MREVRASLGHIGIEGLQSRLTWCVLRPPALEVMGFGIGRRDSVNRSNAGRTPGFPLRNH